MGHEESCVTLSLKTCPICKTHVFDDMSTCYNCMYSFGSNPALEKRLEEESVKGLRGSQLEPSEQTSDLPSVPSGIAGAPLSVPSSGVLAGADGNTAWDADSLFQYSANFYEASEDCIQEYETMIVCNEACSWDDAFASSGFAEDRSDGSARKSEGLFCEFLVEFSSFLREFLLDRKIRI